MSITLSTEQAIRVIHKLDTQTLIHMKRYLAHLIHVRTKQLQLTNRPKYNSTHTQDNSHHTIHDIQSVAEWKYAMKLSYNTPLVVNFTAAKYGPCENITPYFEKLAKQNNQAIFVHVDIQKRQDITITQDIHSMQTFRVYKNAKCVNEVDDQNKARLRLMVDINTNDCVIYVRKFCDSCTQATQLLNRIGAKYRQIDETELDEPIQHELHKHTRGTYPKIFIHGKYIG